MKLEEEIVLELTRAEVRRDRALMLLDREPDWNTLLGVATVNRLDALVFNALDALGYLEKVPPRVGKSFEDRYRQTVINTGVYLEVAGELSAECEKRSIPLVVIRGPALGLSVYGKPYLRPFSDLDLLIRKPDLGDARDVLRRAGFESLPGLLPDRYFLRHHLHLRLRNNARGTVAELHWALDHPYALHTVEYDELFGRMTRAEFAGTALPVLSPEDRLLTLCLHFFKHCPFLPAFLREPDFPSLLFRDRVMLWLLDVHRTAAGPGAPLDWEAVFRTASFWNLRGQLDACLEGAGRLYPIPGAPAGGTAMRKLNFLERRVGRSRIAFLRGETKPGRVGRFLFGLRPDTVFRPVRTLDLLRYIIPPPAFLKRTYKRSGAFPVSLYPRHAARALGRLGRNLFDFLTLRKF